MSKENHLHFDGLFFRTIDSIAGYAILNRKEGVVTEMLPGRMANDIYTITRLEFNKTAEQLADTISEVYRLGFNNQT